MHGGKADKRSDQKAFVRQRVKIGSQAALLIEKSRHQAVGGIAQSCQNKNHETGQKAVVDDENQENGHQEDSKDTDQIRNGHRKGLFKIEKDIVSIGLAQVQWKREVLMVKHQADECDPVPLKINGGGH